MAGGAGEKLETEECISLAVGVAANASAGSGESLGEHWEVLGADVGVAVLAVLNASRAIKTEKL